MTRKNRHRLDDERLLAQRDWRTFTDAELKRAVTLARWRGRKAFRERRGQVEAGGDWALLEEKPHAIMYLAYCACQRDEQDMREWNNWQYLDSINDPRVYEFCCLYDRYQRRFLGLPALHRNRRLLHTLIERRGKDLILSERSLRLNQQEFTRQSTAYQEMNRPVLDAMASGYLKLMHEFLLYRMLLNKATGEWIGG